MHLELTTTSICVSKLHVAHSHANYAEQMFRHPGSYYHEHLPTAVAFHLGLLLNHIAHNLEALLSRVITNEQVLLSSSAARETVPTQSA